VTVVVGGVVITQMREDGAKKVKDCSTIETCKMNEKWEIHVTDIGS